MNQGVKVLSIAGLVFLASIQAVGAVERLELRVDGMV